MKNVENEYNRVRQLKITSEHSRDHDKDLENGRLNLNAIQQTYVWAANLETTLLCVIKKIYDGYASGRI